MKTPLIMKKLMAASVSVNSCLVVTACLFSMPALAQIDQDDLAELRAQVIALANRIAELEADSEAVNNEVNDVSETIAEVQTTSQSSWANKVRVTGDLRTRYENIDDSSKSDSRNRDRIRARLAITAQVNDDWRLGLGLASGGDDPVSTNQTLGNGGSTKGFHLDYAYFQWTGIEDLMITGGKYRNVFYKPGGKNMIFDSDYRPEGLGLKFDNDSVFFNAATFLIESDDKAGSQDEEFMWGLQAGYEMPLANEASLTIGASYYNAAVSGSSPFYKGKAYSNTLAANGTYLFDYEEVELFAQMDFSFQGQPARVFADFVQNQDANDNDTGWLIGAKYGNVSGARTWEIGYIYEDLEADAVFGGFTDSDFANSGTDGKGHVFDFAYGIGRNTEIGVTYYMNEYGEVSLDESYDYDRFHLFLITSF